MKSQTSYRLRREQPDTLFFSPLAWLKLQWFCHAGDTEVGGFGISAEHNPLYVEEFVTVRQQVTPVSIRFDGPALADFFDAMVDHGLKPDRFGRVWMHTHPGSSPLPSSVDEETFARHLGGCDWSVMFILDRAGQTYARLSVSAGPGAQMLLPVAVHWSALTEAVTSPASLDAQVSQWQTEYKANVHPHVQPASLQLAESRILFPQEERRWEDEPWCEEFDGVFFEPVHRQGEPHVQPPF
jgi:hypothetical protein